MEEKALIIGNREFKSRLLVGTGKYANFDVMKKALEASGAEIVTVAIRRLDLGDAGAKKETLPLSGGKQERGMLDYIDRNKYTILPNTAGCYTAEDAIRIARIARGMGLSELVKLEVIGDEKTLFPDTEALLAATKVLVKEGFTVMPYTNDDPIMAKKLADAGAACVMPLASPIGSGMGILNPINITFIQEAVKVPVIVDAGVGTASDVAVAMELGVDGVLMNTGIAGAKDPVGMARAMRLATEAGRLAYLSGRIAMKQYASPSSPITGIIK
ncbi:MAG: thiazole synthase [Candidatus Omnitrophica bacterium]|nr:thiazole synthase [Candidatus Omnitrophota bacterium]MDD5310374.1 thiazole synthase [Candidatus Omnitrophota bacterium]MDD5545919.1 thiazole synthase [Candidatus Omnitrophota bacterium]